MQLTKVVIVSKNIEGSSGISKLIGVVQVFRNYLGGISGILKVWGVVQVFLKLWGVR